MGATCVGIGTPALNNSAATTLNVPYPSVSGGILSTDFLVLAIGQATVAIPNLPAGWLAGGVSSASGGNAPSERIIGKQAAGGETGSFAYTTPSTTSRAVMTVWRGVDLTTPFEDGSVTASATATNSYSLPSITTSAGAGLVLIGVANTVGGTWTTPSVGGEAMTEIMETTGANPSTGVQILSDRVASGATGAVAYGRSTNVRGCTGFLALKPSSTAVNYTPSATDTVGITDSMTKEIGYGDLATDTVGITDAAISTMDRTQSATDTVGISDSAPVVLARSQTPVDGIGLTDSSSAVLDRTDDATDAVGITDSFTVVVNRAFTITDTIGISDPATYGISTTGGQSATDIVGITDSVTPVLDMPRAATDAVGITDSATVVLNRAVTVTDVIGITDTYLDEFQDGQLATDTVGITDSATWVLDRVMTITDVVGITDTASYAGSGVVNQTLTDIVGITDSVSIQIDRAITVTDVVGITDAATAIEDRSITVTDALGITDAITGVTTHNESAIDAVGITDSVTFAITRNVTVTDTVSIIDTAGIAGGDSVQVSDNVGITDSVSLLVLRGNAATDTVGITDSFTFQLTNDGTVPTDADYSGVLRTIYEVELDSPYAVRIRQLEGDADGIASIYTTSIHTMYETGLE